MPCKVRTCDKPETKRKSGLCIGHDFIFTCQDRKETLAEFVTRQEGLGMLLGKTLRREAA